MRIGIVGLLHESNTFVQQPTTIQDFQLGVFAEGEAVETHFRGAHHEIGGFLDKLTEGGEAEVAPLFVARATPSGVIEADSFEKLVNRMLDLVQEAGPLDGVLAAPHGATVAEGIPDADGCWLQRLRDVVGKIPIVATLDAHANLSPTMVRACDAIVAYRTNPHLDQQARGREAARLLMGRLQGELNLHMAAMLPPLAINIERQCTDEPQFEALLSLAERQRQTGFVHSNSLLLGFPYADVEEMGAAVLTVADNPADASLTVRHLANCLWRGREAFNAQLIDVDEALREATQSGKRTCLLDMGDNVGGGSAADGTILLSALLDQQLGPAVACLFDPESVQRCEAAGPGAQLELRVGGKTDRLHGETLNVRAKVVSLHDGRFEETAPRHGGITHFDQGRTAVVQTDSGVTILLNSIRTAPFSLNQLTSCGIEPTDYQFLVAKGVNAPLAAYRKVCDHFIRVNTGGSTCADMQRLTYRCRRRPMFPFEAQTSWSAEDGEIILGFNAGASEGEAEA